MQINRNIIYLSILLLVGCSTTAPASNNPTKSVVIVDTNYDETWKAAMKAVSESQMCEGCFFEIKMADKSVGIISAVANRENQFKGQINLQIAEINKDKTNVTVMASIAQYKYWGNLYGARFSERWENIDYNFSDDIASQILFHATGSVGKANRDIFLKIEIGKTNIKLGEHVTLKYELYTRYDTKYLGFKRDLSVKSEIIDELLKKPDGSGYYEERTFFGCSFPWGSSKNMARVEIVLENSPADHILQENDFIKAVNGEKVNSVEHLSEVLAKQSPTKETKFSILRNEKEFDLLIKPRMRYGQHGNGIIAEYLSPGVGAQISKETKVINNRKYIVAEIQSIKLHFNKSGQFSIDPGAVKVTTSNITRVLESEPINVIVED